MELFNSPTPASWATTRWNLSDNRRKTLRRLLFQQFHCWSHDQVTYGLDIFKAYGFQENQSVNDRSANSFSLAYSPKPLVQVKIHDSAIFLRHGDVVAVLIPGHHPITEYPWGIDHPAAVLDNSYPGGWRWPEQGVECMQARLAFRELFLWLADFEKWVQQTKGLYYRRDSLQLWARRAICPGHLMPSAWRGFACEAVRGPAPDVAPITVHNVKQARQISVSIREQNSYAA